MKVLQSFLNFIFFWGGRGKWHSSLLLLSVVYSNLFCNNNSVFICSCLRSSFAFSKLIFSILNLFLRAGFFLNKNSSSFYLCSCVASSEALSNASSFASCKCFKLSSCLLQIGLLRLAQAEDTGVAEVDASGWAEGFALQVSLILAQSLVTLV